MTITDASTPSFAAFVERVTGLLPFLDGNITEATTVDEVCGGDRVKRVLLTSKMMSDGAFLPEVVLAEVRTFGDAFEWSSRNGQGPREFPRRSVDGLPDAVETARVRLRPIRPPDFQWLYEVAASPRTGYRWSFRGVTPNPQTFADTLYRGTLAQFVVEKRGTGEVCGLVDGYDASLADRHVKIAIVSASGPNAPMPDGAPGPRPRRGSTFHLVSVSDL